MANLKKVQATLAKKQALLDDMDDQLSGMPEMSMEAPMGGSTSPEFDLLSQKREELEKEILSMQEGIQLLSKWEELKNGPWSPETKGMLSEIDIEMADIAGGEPAPAGDMLGGAMPPDLGAPMPDMGAPVPDLAAPAPEAPLPPAPAPDALAPEAPVEEAPAPAPEEVDSAPMTPMASAKSPTSKKNSYQSPDKKGISAPSNMKKDGSIMANETTEKPSLKDKIADVKSKREAIKKEAQARVAAAWTIAKTMLPGAPSEKQKEAASNFLQLATPVLNAMLRQTAKNAHYTKVAETFKSVHKVEMNDLLEDPSILKSEKSAVEKELKGEAKSAAAPKVADDRKDAGPQEGTYNDGRGCGGGKHTEPTEMDAGSAKSQTEAEHRPENTINKSEGGKAAAAKAAAKAAAAPKVAECKCDGECKCASKEAAVESKHAGHKPDCDCNFCEKKKKGDKKDEKAAAVKTADPVMDAPPMEDAAPAMDAPPAEPGLDAVPAEEMPMDAPVEEGAPEGDSPAEVLTDEQKMRVEEKIEEAQEAISALEKEILEESAEGEELDYSQIFNEDDMEDKVSALANEGDEKQAGNGEEYFAPSAAESLEASLDEPQMASMEDFFSLKGSDSDPLAHLIAGEVRTAAEVAGMEVIPSSTGELAKKMESNSATGESRDNENDHEGDLFAEAIENVTPEDGGFKRVKQDETNELEAPKSAAAKTASAAPKEKKESAVISKLKTVTAAEKKPVDIASALFGNDEF